MVLDAATGPLGPGGGVTNGKALGFESVVVKIKNVMSKNARSTIAVKSTRAGIRCVRLPPNFPGEETNSAMIVRVKVKKLVISSLRLAALKE